MSRVVSSLITGQSSRLRYEKSKNEGSPAKDLGEIRGEGIWTRP